MSERELERLLKNTELTPDQANRVRKADQSNPQVVSRLEIKALVGSKADLGRMLEELRYSS